MQDDNAVRSKLHVNILSQPQRQHNTTQPQHCTWVGHENCCAHPTHPPEQHQTIIVTGNPDAANGSRPSSRGATYPSLVVELPSNENTRELPLQNFYINLAHK